MRIFNIVILFLLVFVVNLLFVGSQTFAESFNPITIYSPNGKPFFKINIANKDSTVWFDDVPYKSSFTLNNDQVNAIKRGMEYWAWVLKDHSNTSLFPEISLYTGADTGVGASASSFTGTQNMTVFGDEILGYHKYNEPVARIDVNNYTWNTGNISSLPNNGDNANIGDVILHELGHALGFSSDSGVLIDGDKDKPRDYYFTDEPLSLWTQGLRNEDGESPTPEQKVVDFLPRSDSGVYFTGDDVDMVLDGALLTYADDSTIGEMPGIPILGWEGKAAELSHTELQNSLMSHQNYRNWNIFMEAELAILQDIDYDIDRRDFFGYSVYNSDKTLTNNNPYFARNADGTAYINGAYNATPWGMGLHIYGSGNNITQTADILSSGNWGIGIRVDGVENTLTINPNTKVHANGYGGNALAVTYGNSHDIVHRGDLKAQGEGGIAARFDFGSNTMGNKSEYRGSWLRIFWSNSEMRYKKITDDPADPRNEFHYPRDFPSALEGSLVDSFDVTGSLSGAAAAIYIADNAHVQNINIMNGASISGDIISNWDPSWDLLEYNEDKRENLLTNLTFGFKANADGTSTPNADSNFSMSYTGNIFGGKSMLMSVEGGRLTFNGAAQLISVEVKKNATLAGTGRYKVGLIDKTYTGISRSFVNKGTLLTYNPENLADMSGLHIEANDFDSTAGKLGVLVNGTGKIGGLTLTGAAANKDETFAKLFITPAKDYYSSKVNIDLNYVVNNTGKVTYTDNKVGLIEDSPTLKFTVQGDTSTAVQLIVTRSENAYSQYASNDASKDTGYMILNIASSSGAISGDMKTLISTLDFSSQSTVTTALEQLSGESYENIKESALDGQHAISGAMMRHMLVPPINTDKAGKIAEKDTILVSAFEDSEEKVWRAFSSVFGMGQKQQDVGDTNGYSASGIGIMGGIERDFDSGLTAGMHLALQHRQSNSNNADDALVKTDAVSIGVHGHFKPINWNGGYILGQLRGGIESNTMKRKINFDTYIRQNNSDWLAYIFSGTIGGGWDITLENVTLGPVAWLDYSAIINPEFTESDGMASRLNYDANTLQSLRSSLGGRFAIQHTLEYKQIEVQGDILAAWQHELLTNHGSSRIGFVGYEQFSTSQTNKVKGRDSMLLQLGAQAKFSDNAILRLQVGSELFREGYSSLMGSVSLSWEF